MFIYDFQVRDDFTNKASKQQTLYIWIFYHSNSKTCAHIPQKICKQDVQRLRRVIHKEGVRIMKDLYLECIPNSRTQQGEVEYKARLRAHAYDSTILDTTAGSGIF